MLVKKVLATIREHNLISAGDHVVLGLSGGPDSVCLFHLLLGMKAELGISLDAVHVNHMMREETNYRDEEFVGELCREHGIACHVYPINCKQLAQELKLTSEEAGRMARYSAFVDLADDLAEDGNPVKIALAHNADDQAETLLFRILRGTGTDGLAGMEHRRIEGEHEVIRPLLDVTRDEIEHYLHKNNFEYVVDETNAEAIYTRNKIRLEMLPMIKEQFNDNIVGALNRLAEVATTDKNYIWEHAEHAYTKALVEHEGARVVLNQVEVKGLHKSIRHRVLLKALRNVGLMEDVTHERLVAADQLMDGNSSTKVIELPHGYRITFAFGEIIVKRESGDIPDERGVQSELVEAAERVTDIKTKLASEGYDSDTLCMDADKVAEASGIEAPELATNVVARKREEGDYICIKSGTKKIKKLLGEMKIPADEREQTLIIAVGHCVLCVKENNTGNTRFAEKLRVDDKTKAVLIVKVV